MQTDQQKQTNIDFDADWKCLCRPTHGKNDQDRMVFETSHLQTNDGWSSVQLPHLVNTVKQGKQSECSPCQWWYCKQFQWLSKDKSIDQRIYLMLRSSDDLNITSTVWLNGTQVYCGSLRQGNTPIELPSTLLRYDNPEQKKNNDLTIGCSDSPLSFHAHLVIYGDIIYASGQVALDEKSEGEANKLENDVLDYTVGVDDTEGRIDMTFKSKRKYKAPVKPTPTRIPSAASDTDVKNELLVPRLAIVILIVGTRGDVQPFIALGQALRASGHRVRLATHETFRSFVRGNGLEFYPLAGDPADLISFMVKNSGVIPSVSSIVAGDVTKKRRSLSEILASTWQACIANDDETNIPFTAEAIIANPPSFGHIHCAEKLQIPLHIMFTMPWSPTTVFAHPLSNINTSTGPKETVNRYSYVVIDMLTWTGMRDIVNDFRRKTLGLLTLNTSQAVCALVDEQVPHTYCWSPSLVSKPHDWDAHIDVSGFFFLDLGTVYTNPAEDLLRFLDLDNDPHRSTSRRPAPIYIGFGSIAGHDCRRILNAVIEAINQTGYRAVLSGLATDADQLPANIFRIGNVPHDWLFQHVSAVCHHGGAGTTAAGLRAGKPTIIVPFFGDQFFWGTVVEKSGAGPKPIPGKALTGSKLAEAFHFVAQATTRAAAQRLSDLIVQENGCASAVHAFHTNLPLSGMHSDLEPTFPACYRSDRYKIQISRPVAQVLVSAGLIDESQLRRHSTRQWKFMHDNHKHVFTHGLFEHFRKAFSTMFIDTAGDLKRAASVDDLALRTRDSAGSVAKGVGLGIGHLTIGYLSLYGELTDVLEYATTLYDPYSTTKPYSRPVVNNFKSGAIAAGVALWNGWKDGVTGIVKTPRAGYQRHGWLGGAAGSFIATVNIGVKPAVGTLASLTWLTRGTYAAVRNIVQNYRSEGRHISPKLVDINASLTNQIDQHSRDDHPHLSVAAKRAATISGFHPKICEHIIDEFEKIKSERDRKKDSSLLKKLNPVSFFSNSEAMKRSSSHSRLALTHSAPTKSS